MLKSELARFKIKGEQVIPLFAQPDDDVIPILIDLFRKGRNLSEIREEIKTLSKVYDYKLVNGLSAIMSRLCKFEGTNGSPPELRRFLFSRGPVLDQEERERILREASAKFNVDPMEAMYSDMKDEMRILEVPSVSPEQLTKMYNLSLLQTMLFKAFKMKVYMRSGWKELIRLSKSLGLMYYAYREPQAVEFMGPMTLLKLSDRYGRNLALLLPEVVKEKDWTIDAEVVLGKNRRIYKLHVDSSPLVGSLGNVEVDGKTEFDSKVEETFYREFKAVARDWEIIREPGYLVVDDDSGRVMIPDFMVRRGDVSFYVEIVGFWTKEYLEEKVYKLRNVREKVLVLVSEDLATDKVEGEYVMTFRKKVDVTKVYRWMMQNLPKADLSGVKIQGDYVKLMDLARKLGVQVKDVKSIAERSDGYVVLKTFAVKKEILERMSKEDFNGKDIAYVREKYGPFAEEAMEYLGYMVKYKDLFSAVITRS